MPQVCLAEKVQAFVQKQPPTPQNKQTNKQTPPTPEMST